MINSTLCYIEQNGKYLMLYRNKKKNDINEGKWIGIGGKVEEGESPDECIRREVAEESGLILGKVTPRGIITFVSDACEGEYMHLFTSNDFSGALSECSEGDLEWIDKDKIPALPLWEGDRIFLELLRAECPFFDLKLVYSGDKLVSARLDGEEINV